MAKGKARLLAIGTLAISFSVAHAQSPQQVIQRVVNAEYAADENDHSQWIYLKESRTPKVHLLEWVAGTQQGNVERVLERDEQRLSESQQRDLIRRFLDDPRARKKQLSESDHDNRQIDDLLHLLPIAFLWTETGATATTTSLHFEPAPNFHPPTREARVFSAMAGDLVADNQQLRIRSMSGRLIHNVTFGGGILGDLKEGSTFALEQEQVGPSLWQLTAFEIHLKGSALLFKSISLQQDEERSRFEPEPATVTLDQAATAIMGQPQGVHSQEKPH